MTKESDLCRGWTASDIRAALADASETQRAVVATIAANPHTTTAEIADELGWSSHRNVRSTLAAFSQTTRALGVTDRAGKLSWPFEIEESRPGSNFCRYYMPPAATEVVFKYLGGK